jgi:hypothetical protein
MTIFQNRKTGLMYAIYRSTKEGKEVHIAIPHRHAGRPIVGIDLKDYSPIESKSGHSGMGFL